MSQIERIDVYMPQRSQYSVLHHFTKELYSALLGLGLQCRLLEGAQLFDAAKSSPADLSIAFNGAPLLPSGELLADAIARPHLCWLVDLPYHCGYVLKSPHIYVACDDETSCQLLQQLGHQRHFFLPQAADFSRSIASDVPRDILISFLASYFDFEKERRSWWDLPYRFCQLLESSAAEAWSEPQKSFVFIFLENYQKLSAQANEPLMTQRDVFELLKRLEYYLKGKARASVVLAQPEGVLHLFDERWQPFLLKQQRSDITLHAAVSYTEGLQWMQRSKIVLSNTMRSPFGGSERVLNAYAAGALPLTNASPYMCAQFKADEQIAYYSHTALEALTEQVRELLGDEVQRSAMIASGRHKAMKEHSWQARATTMLQQLNQWLG